MSCSLGLRLGGVGLALGCRGTFGGGFGGFGIRSCRMDGVFDYFVW